VAKEERGWRGRLHEIVFEADTPSGKLFDIALLVAIAISIFVVVLESVQGIRLQHGRALRIAEWSFFGVIDLLSILPTYLSLFVDGAQALLVIRGLRLLRVFRVFQATAFALEFQILIRAVRATAAKIIVFLLTVITLVLILGATIYAIEGPEHGFKNIPIAVYWAVVTVTTVGYGDLAPMTVPGRIVAAIAMLLGYSLIIIPTGIFSMELARSSGKPLTTQNCRSCTREGHEKDAVHCKFCGAIL
jgi:voltage-gated potassium channel